MLCTRYERNPRSPWLRNFNSVTKTPTIIVFDLLVVVSKNVLRVNKSFASMFDKAEDGISRSFPGTGGGA
jgi:hypothetical protein